MPKRMPSISLQYTLLYFAVILWYICFCFGLHIPIEQEIRNIDNEDTPSYRLTNDSDSTCILLKGDILIKVSYSSLFGHKVTDTYVPEDPSIGGTCESSVKHAAILQLSWGSYRLRWMFFKSPNEDHWFIGHIKLTLKADIPSFHHIRSYASEFTLINNHVLFKTPMQQSLFCEERVISLMPADKKSQAVRLKAILHIKQLHLQPFMDSESATFGPICNCSYISESSFKIVPITDHFVYIAIVLLVVVGYFMYREMLLQKQRDIEKKQLK